MMEVTEFDYDMKRKSADYSFQYLSNIIPYSIILVIYALLAWFWGASAEVLGQMVHYLVEPFLFLESYPCRRFDSRCALG